MTTAGSIQLCKDIATMETGRCSGFLIKTGETWSDSISWKNYWGGFQLSFLCVWKWKPSTTFSGNDGFFDLTHVGTGERLNVQESWANKHPRNDGCVVAYLGEHKLSDLLLSIFKKNCKNLAFQKNPSTTACTIWTVTKQTRCINGIGLYIFKR